MTSSAPFSNVTHDEARRWLHAGRRRLRAAELWELDRHLAGCGECRAYAAQVEWVAPALTTAMRARWDGAPPAPSGPFVERLLARAGRMSRSSAASRSRWSSYIPLLPATVFVVLAIVLVLNLGGQGGVLEGQTPAPAASVVPTLIRNVLPAPTLVPTAAPTAASLLNPGPALVAFLAQQANGAAEVMVMHLDGSGLLNLSHSPAARETMLAWSPDGTRLAFVSDRTGQPEVFSIRPDGTDLTQLTETAAPNADYDYVIAWSPDGTRLALALLPHEISSQWRGGLYLMFVASASQAVPGEGALLLAEAASDVRWSPDGRYLAYSAPDESGRPALYAAPGGGTPYSGLVNWRPARLTPETVAGEFNVYLGFDWSPDGTRLAYLESGPWQGERTAATIAPDAAARIVTVDPDNAWRFGEPRPAVLLETQALVNGIRGLTWSPDGATLAFVADEGGNCWHVFLLGASDTVLRQMLTTCFVIRTAMPAWSGDGRFLLFGAMDKSIGPAGLGLLDVASARQGSGTTPVVPVSGLSFLDHSPVVQPGRPLAPVCNLRHTVEPFDTALSIAAEYGADLGLLGSVNGLDENFTVSNGRSLIIPRACE